MGLWRALSPAIASGSDHTSVAAVPGIYWGFGGLQFEKIIYRNIDAVRWKSARNHVKVFWALK